MATLTATSAPPCPAWCVLPPGHDSGPDAYTDGERYVRHRRLIGPDVEIQQAEIVGPDGVVETEPLEIVLDGHAHDIARAQQLAVELAAAFNTTGEPTDGEEQQLHGREDHNTKPRRQHKQVVDEAIQKHGNGATDDDATPMTHVLITRWDSTWEHGHRSTERFRNREAGDR